MGIVVLIFFAFVGDHARGEQDFIYFCKKLPDKLGGGFTNTSCNGQFELARAHYRRFFRSIRY